MPPRARGGLTDQIVSPSSRSRPLGLSSRCINRNSPVSNTSVSRRSFSATPLSAMPSLKRQQMFQYYKDKGSAYIDSTTKATKAEGDSADKSGPVYLTRFGAVDEVDETFEQVKQEIKQLEFEMENGVEGEEVEEENSARSGLKPYHAFKDRLRPFPLNPYFYSEPVLSEKLKETVWKMVKEDGKSVRQTSVEPGIDMNRIGAVIRLKGVERSWMAKGKPLARTYARAITSMLPLTQPGEAHESINDLPIHRSTKEQIFYPVAESRSFTRAEAAEAFERGLLPADARIPHPQLVHMHRELNHPDPKISDAEAVAQRMDEAYASEAQRRQEVLQRREDFKRKNEIRVEGERATFRIQNVTVDETTVGKDGRGRKGVGFRYGMPHEDRKKGQVKIPTRVGSDA